MGAPSTLIFILLASLCGLSQSRQIAYDFGAETYPRVPGYGYLYNHANFLAYLEARDYLLVLNKKADDPSTSCPKAVRKAGDCPPGNATQVNSTITNFFKQTGTFRMNAVLGTQSLYVASDGLLGYTPPGTPAPEGSYTDLFTLGLSCQGSQTSFCTTTLVFNNTMFAGGNFYSCPPSKSLQKRLGQKHLNVTYAPIKGISRDGCTKIGLSSSVLALPDGNGKNADEPFPCPYTGSTKPKSYHCPPIAYEYD